MNQLLISRCSLESGQTGWFLCFQQLRLSVRLPPSLHASLP